MYLALSICLFFILLMQLLKEAQFLNTTFLPLFFGLFPACPSTIIVPLTCISALLNT